MSVFDGGPDRSRQQILYYVHYQWCSGPDVKNVCSALNNGSLLQGTKRRMLTPSGHYVRANSESILAETIIVRPNGEPSGGNRMEGRQMDSNHDPEIVADYERDTWARCAENYVDTFAGITGEAIPELIKMGSIGAGTHVLEIGSGPGHVAYTLSKTGANVRGIDFSINMVEVAKRRYPEIPFEQADAEQLPFDQSSFDVVVASFVVHHLARPQTVLKEVRRVLKPGGKFVFAVWGAAEEQSSIGAFFGAVAAHHDLDELPHGPMFGVVGQEVFEPLLSSAGLENCQISILPLVWKTDSIDPIIQGFWDFGDMSALPADTQNKIKQSTIDNSEPYRKGEGYAFPHPILFGSASKAT